MKLALLVVLGAVLLAGCGGAARPPGARACDPALDRDLRAWAQAGFSGSVAIASDGGIECVGGYGVADKATARPNTPRTVFSIGSITKAFTAAAVLNLADAGKLSLSDRAGELLPSLRGPVAAATVEQLLLHTSGLKGTHAGDREPLTKRKAIAAIGGLEQAFAPGRRFLYSNAGYTLLALIVERVSGTSFRKYVASHILRLPDGRTAGGFWDGAPAARGPRAVGYLEDGSAGAGRGFAGPYWAVEGNGGLAMTMRELAAWTHALFTGRIVSRRVVDAIATPSVRTDRDRSESPGWVLYDASVFGRPVLATAGGGGDVGHNAIVVWLPSSRRALAVASNGPDITAERLVEKIGPALAAGRPLPHPKGTGQVGARADLAAFAGRYGRSLRVGVRGDRLTIAAEEARAVAVLFPLPRDVTRADATAHEALVRALLAGSSQDGAKERRALESSLGPIDGVRVVGTVVHDGELRTYVLVRAGRRSMRLWYALNEEGAVAAAQGPADPPTATLLATGPDTFRVDDPAGSAPPVSVSFDAGRITVVGPAGRVSARRR